jgi:general stress protein 26
LAQIILGRNDSKFVQIKGIAPLQGEVIAKEKYTEKVLKTFFSRSSRPKLIKLGTNYLWVKGQVLFKKEIITKI